MDSAPAADASPAVDELLDRLTAAMGTRGEDRPGQREMAHAIAAAIRRRRHLIVQAGTGTGKSLGYLIPVLATGRTAVIATATKGLQDQLADNELPFLSQHAGRSVNWTVLKGRSNYLCLQRLDEVEADRQGTLDVGASQAALTDAQLAELRSWAATTSTGDRADLANEPTDRQWSQVSVGPRECPGAAKCPRGEDCFAELARKRAAAADVIVVNTHLYGLHLAAGSMILPKHDVVVFDEAHEVPDIISATTGREVGPMRFVAAARIAGGLLNDGRTLDGLETSATQLDAALRPVVGERFTDALPEDVASVLAVGRTRLDSVLQMARNIDAANPDIATRVARVVTAITALVDDLTQVTQPSASVVTWVSAEGDHPRINQAPLDVGWTLDRLLWNPESTGLDVVTDRSIPGTGASTDSDDDESDSGPDVPQTVILASATIPPGLNRQLRIPPERHSELDVGTPFDFEHQGLLYCPTHLPAPRAANYAAAMFDELERLINAAGGRTLALFTSHRMMQDAANELSERLDVPVLRQGDLPKPRLIARFADEPETCLFATMGFWQGIDVPGPSLSLVTIDKIPFPRPDEPLLQARREAVGSAAFKVIDVPKAATLLAQGAGRLIRRSSDRGVVAILDSRLATSKHYRWDLINAMPPLRRTKDFADVAELLAECATAD